MEYLLKTTAIIAIFYTFYKLILQRETFFQVNRWFLFLGLIFALVGPLIIIPNYIEYTVPEITQSEPDFSTINKTTPSLPEFNIENQNTQTTPKQNPKPIQNSNFIEQEQDSFTSNISLTLWDYVLIIYILGILYFTFRFTFQLSSVYSLIKKNKSVKAGPYKVIRLNNDAAPFSFFKWIIYNPNQFNETELRQVITHEKVHANQMHSIDILLSEIISIAFWFNPLIWLYNKAIKQNLEYIADSVAQHKSESNKSYQYTLIKTCVPSHQMALTNTFYNSLIKKRILMLQKSKSKNINLIKYALIIPALAFFLMSFNTETIYVEKHAIGSKHPIKVKDSNTKYVLSFLTEKDLESMKSEFKKKGISINYHNIQRNEWNLITKIEIQAKTENKTVSATFGDGKNEIPNIQVGLLDSGDLVTKSVITDPRINALATISSYSQKPYLEHLRDKLKEEGVIFTYKDLKYNKANELTSIAVSLNDGSNTREETIYNGGNPIFPFYIYKTDNISYTNGFYAGISTIYQYLLNNMNYNFENRQPLTSMNSDLNLYNFKDKLKKQGVNLSFSDIKRKGNTITQITISISKGKKIITKTYGNGTYEIPTIMFGAENNGDLFLSTFGFYTKNSFDNLPNDIIKRFAQSSFLITKFTTSSDLETLKNNLQKYGNTLIYSDLNYNKNNEIINITTQLTKGDSTIVKTWNNNGLPISPIEISTNKTTPNIYGIFETFNFEINKNTTDKSFEYNAKNALKVGTTLNFTEIKRNSKNEIIGLKAQFKNQFKSSTLIFHGDTPIEPFRYNQIYSTSGWLNNEGNYSIQPNLIITQNSKEDKPLLVLNDEILSIEQLRINNTTENITVLKGEKALEKYGNQAKNGAIEVNTKDQKLYGSLNPMYRLNNIEIPYEEYKNRILNVEDIQYLNINTLKTAEGNNLDFFNIITKPEYITEGSIKMDKSKLLFVVDDQEQSFEFVKNITPYEIESFQVLTTAKALKNMAPKAKMVL